MVDQPAQEKRRVESRLGEGEGRTRKEGTVAGMEVGVDSSTNVCCKMNWVQLYGQCC